MSSVPRIDDRQADHIGPANVREISVRLQDGSVRVFHEAVTAKWNEGDRVKVSMGRIKPLS